MEIWNIVAGVLLADLIMLGLRRSFHAIANRNARRGISKWQSHTRRAE